MESLPPVASSLNIWHFIRKHLYMILFLIFTIPVLISYFRISLQTHNFLYPLLRAGINILDADAVLFNMVNSWVGSGVLFGIIRQTGIWNSVVYFWDVFKTIWTILADLFLISFPFFIVYKIAEWRDRDKGMKNLITALVWSLIFLFTINLIVTIYELISGSFSMVLNSSLDNYQKMAQIIFSNLPFHGVVSLIKYILGLIH